MSGPIYEDVSPDETHSTNSSSVSVSMLSFPPNSLPIASSSPKAFGLIWFTWKKINRNSKKLYKFERKWVNLYIFGGWK